MVKRRQNTFWAHRLALVESRQIGAGTRVWPFAHVLRGAVIGVDCNIGEHCFIENDVRVGDRVTIKNGVALWEGIRIVDHAFIGPYAVFTNDARPRSPRLADVHDYYAQRRWYCEITVEEGATVGANATILPGLRLGRFCLIGAGSVVTRDVPPFTLVYGVPARAHGRVNRRGEPLVRRGRFWVEPHSGERYRLHGDDLCPIS